MTSPTQRFCFISDLDGTLLPNQNETPPSGCLERTINMLQTLMDNDCIVAYCTGRNLSMAKEVVPEYGLPVPDYWLVNVGTEIYYPDGSHLDEWQTHLGEPLPHEKIADSFAAWEQLKIQASELNGPYKISFRSPNAPEPQLLLKWQDALSTLTDNAKMIISVEPKTGDTLIDVVAEKSGKANACHFLRNKYGLSPSDVFFSGDSGNDVDALEAGFNGTLVANAPDNIKAQVRRGGGKVFISTQPYGDGVIDGLQHYDLIK